jgi:hypothetical protein
MSVEVPVIFFPVVLLIGMLCWEYRPTKFNWFLPVMSMVGFGLGVLSMPALQSLSIQILGLTMPVREAEALFDFYRFDGWERGAFVSLEIVFCGLLGAGLTLLVLAVRPPNKTKTKQE